MLSKNEIINTELATSTSLDSELSILRTLEECLRNNKREILMEKKKSNCNCSRDSESFVFRTPAAFLINDYLQRLDKLRDRYVI